MSSKSDFLDKLRAVVLEHHSDEQFGVSELVEKFGMSRSQIHRKLKAANGKSISQFIREVRLDEALKLLRENDYTASEVSYMVGFNSPTYFNTCFHEYFGFPPGEAKHHDHKVIPLTTEKPKRGRKNLRVGVWLIVITLIVGYFFVVKYIQHGNQESADIATDKLKTIAVLPFKNWSGDPNLEYVSDGMTDAVITRLSGISDIDRVVPFTSIITYKGSDKTTDEIAKELNVEYILEGNFKLSGEQVMSNLNLIEVAGNKYLWSLEYTGEWKTDQIFEMQADIAENVAQNMKADITEIEKVELAHIPTTNEMAYMTYLNANALSYRLNNEGIKAAIPIFERAIEQDSTFIEPYMGLADNYLVAGLWWGIMEQKEAWELAETYYLKALEMDSRKNGYYYEWIKGAYCRGKFLFELDFDCVEDFVDEDPDRLTSVDPFYNYNDYCRKTGRLETAFTIMDKAIVNNPVNPYLNMQKAILYYYMGDNENALYILSALDTSMSSEYFYLIETAKYYYYMGEIDKSKKHLEILNENFDSRPPLKIWLNTVHADRDGDNKKVLEGLQLLEDYYSLETSGSPAWFLGLYYVGAGDLDKAFEWLNKSYQRSEVELTWFKEEPVLQPIKRDPRYIELYNKMGWQRFEVLD